MIMDKLLIATGNAGKLVEIKAFLAGLPIEFVGLNDLGLVNDIVEN